MIRSIPLEVNLYDGVYDNSFPENQYYILTFDEIPSKYGNKKAYSIDVLSHFENLGFTKYWQNNSQRNLLSTSTHEIVYVDIFKRMLIKIRITYTNDKLVFIDYLYDLKKGELGEQIDLDAIAKYQTETKRANINLIKNESGYLDIEEFNIEVPEIDLELNYGKDFIKVHELIVSRLNKDRDKGIILLHGSPGNGKTSYLKYLTKFITNKNILFLPPSMAEVLAEPTIIPFLIENKNSVLIIEDAERVISDRETNGFSAGVSNILNLTDGILGDCLNIQVIATFNTKREKIDQALLRKGRLIAEHKFNNLSVEETNKLLQYLNKNVISDKPLSLADIYNIDSDIIRCENEKTKIGFKF